MALRQISSILLRSLTPSCGLLYREPGRHRQLINAVRPIASLSAQKMTNPAENLILNRLSGTGGCCSYSTSTSATLRVIGTSPTSISRGLLVVGNINATSSLLKTPDPLLLTSTRNVIKMSKGKGRRKTVKAVIRRFYRLDWGAWISPKPGRARHLWKKSAQRRQRLRNHIFRTSNENRMLDKMMTKYWIKKKYFVDDPYETYHTRDNFPITKGVQGITSINLFKNRRYVNPRKSRFS